MSANHEEEAFGDLYREDLEFEKLPDEMREALESEITDPALRAAEEVEEYARDLDRTVHPSAIIELENYARHIGVASRSEEQIRQVLVRLGRLAVQETVQKKEKAVNAGAVRWALGKQCNDPFSPCSAAAARMLESE